MKKQLLKWTIVGFCSVLGVTALGAGQVSAHGYITSPGSRAYLGSNAFTNDTGSYDGITDKLFDIIHHKGAFYYGN
ncbi:hypothetical protein [Latilactobacillus sakei]|nr:hypothetical protein [Latilactobacillus sakei]ASN12604.1 hypothetical protein B4V05_05050 [Latilactobacillus sakei]USG06069.1 hypothetical protein A4W88_05335 [Latilactobacillus sakei]